MPQPISKVPRLNLATVEISPPSDREPNREELIDSFLLKHGLSLKLLNADQCSIIDTILPQEIPLLKKTLLKAQPENDDPEEIFASLINALIDINTPPPDQNQDLLVHPIHIYEEDHKKPPKTNWGALPTPPASGMTLSTLPIMTIPGYDQDPESPLIFADEDEDYQNFLPISDYQERMDVINCFLRPFKYELLALKPREFKRLDELIPRNLPQAAELLSNAAPFIAKNSPIETIISILETLLSHNPASEAAPLDKKPVPLSNSLASNLLSKLKAEPNISSAVEKFWQELNLIPTNPEESLYHNHISKALIHILTQNSLTAMDILVNVAKNVNELKPHPGFLRETILYQSINLAAAAKDELPRSTTEDAQQLAYCQRYNVPFAMWKTCSEPAGWFIKRDTPPQEVKYIMLGVYLMHNFLRDRPSREACLSKVHRDTSAAASYNGKKVFINILRAVLSLIYPNK